MLCENLKDECEEIHQAMQRLFESDSLKYY